MNDKVLKNIRASRNISIIAYVVGALCFLAAYFMSKIIWFLVAFIILMTAAVLFIFLFQWVEKRLTRNSPKK